MYRVCWDVAHMYTPELCGWVGLHVNTRSFKSRQQTRDAVGLLLDQHRRRWVNIKSTVGQRLLFSGRTAAGSE